MKELLRILRRVEFMNCLWIRWKHGRGVVCDKFVVRSQFIPVING